MNITVQPEQLYGSISEAFESCCLDVLDWNDDLAATQFEELRKSGWRVATIDCSAAVRDRLQLFDSFARQLQFPGYFGRNWDALIDCLSDLNWYAESGHRVCVVLRCWRDYQNADAQAYETLELVLRAVAERWAPPAIEHNVLVVVRD